MREKAKGQQSRRWPSNNPRYRDAYPSPRPGEIGATCRYAGSALGRSDI
jgi:hypothetical protein